VAKRNVMGALLAVTVAVVAACGGTGGGGTETAVSAPGTTAPAAAPSFFAAEARPEPQAPLDRNPVAWPFTAASVWNLPLGRDARRVPAGLTLSRGGVSIDEDILVLDPTAPLVDILEHNAGWDPKLVRCSRLTGNVLYRGVPIPSGFVTDPGFLGATPNHSAAILLADGDTVIQTQPLHRCQAGGPAVSQFRWAQVSLRNGDGIAGAHGGSQMSSIGGTIRVGELVPGGALRHALKINLDCAAVCAYNPADPDGSPGFRWPALSADADASVRYRGKNAAVQMGALLALPASFDVDGLRTEPGRMVARALQRYGAYVVDDTGYASFALTTEWGPNGRVADEFERVWGFPIDGGTEPTCTDDGPECAWARDIADAVAALDVIDDNGPTSVGGAGARVFRCAPPFAGQAATPPPAGCPAN